MTNRNYTAILLKRGSPKIKHLLPDAGFSFSSLLASVFIYAMLILFDTAKGILVLLENEN